jgi:hypothetical protein
VVIPGVGPVDLYMSKLEVLQEETANFYEEQRALQGQASADEIALAKKAAATRAKLQKSTNAASLSAASTLGNAMFGKSKAFQVAQGFIAARMASLQALNTPPGPPATYPLSRAVLFKGLAEVAVMQGIVPSFATGTRNAPGGMALVGERGPELVNLPKGSSVATAPETRREMGGGTFSGIFQGATLHFGGTQSTTDMAEGLLDAMEEGLTQGIRDGRYTELPRAIGAAA